jgi:hypothetical protein
MFRILRCVTEIIIFPVSIRESVIRDRVYAPVEMIWYLQTF